jgi:hypothetical protein
MENKPHAYFISNLGSSLDFSLFFGGVEGSDRGEEKKP